MNTRLLLPGKLEGIGWFTAETLKRITCSHPEHEFLFIFDRAFSEEFIFSGNIRPVVVFPQARHPLLWYLWFEYSVPEVLRRHKADFFLSPDGYLSLSSKVPSLPVIHDLNFIHRPYDLPWLTRNYYRHFFPGFIKSAVRLATVSDFSKKDICGTFEIPGEKVDVVYNGAGRIFQPLSPEKNLEAKNEYSGGFDYFLYVGAIQPRKNIAGLLAAYEIFRKSGGAPVKLLITGERKFSYPQMEKVLADMRFSQEVIFTGYKGHAELCRLYSAAVALIYIPFFEGFGIPLLEAMNCDTPVITSNRTSLPEVAGDAALLIDPEDRESIAGAMHRIVSDSNCRKILIDRSRMRRKLFSWDSTAGMLWNSMEKAFAGIKL